MQKKNIKIRAIYWITEDLKDRVKNKSGKIGISASQFVCESLSASLESLSRDHKRNK